MGLKMIKDRVVVSALVALSCLSLGAAGCGEEDDKAGGKTDAGGSGEPDGDGGGKDGPDGGGGGAGTYEASFTLIPITDTDDRNPIVTPHKVIVWDAATGAPLDPAVETMTASGTGKFTLKGLPKDRVISIYVPGVGPADEATSTYDTILVNFNPKGGDPLFRISTKGLLAVAPASAGFDVKQDRASAAGAIYWGPAGTRKGNVGCAKICIDGKPPAEDLSVRYVPPNQSLPAPLATQSQTSRSGRFYAGKITVGKHTLAASLDDCKTTLAEGVEFSVPFSRAEAKSEVKAVILQLFIDLDLAENPTPSSCPTP